MNKAYFVVCTLFFVLTHCTQQIKPPEIEISNGLINAGLYLPDLENGLYQGSRFDHSGIIGKLEYKGHSYFGKWFRKYDPEKHDAIMGPVEVFAPLGYDQAKTGDTFVKIGVGAIKKLDESPYDFSKPYSIVNQGHWGVNKSSNQVQFIHTLADEKYGYEYVKTISLTENKAEMVIFHSLKNKGAHSIETTVYNHNFFVIDNQPTGPDFVITLPINLTVDLRGMEDAVKLYDNQIRFKSESGQIKMIQINDLTSGKNIDYDIRIENSKTAAGVRITGDKPISKLAFWSIPSTLCPEPYIDIKVEPGQEFTWSIIYEFYQIDTLASLNHHGYKVAPLINKC